VNLGGKEQEAANEMTSAATIQKSGWQNPKQGAAVQGKDFEPTMLAKAIAVAADSLPGIVGKASSFARVNTERQQPKKLSKSAQKKKEKKKMEKKSDGRHNDVRGLTVETARGIHHLAAQDGKVTFHCGKYTSVKTIPAGHMLVLDMRIMEKNAMGIEHSHGDGRADQPFKDKKQQVISVSTVTRIAIDPKELERLCSAKTSSVSTQTFVSFVGKFVAPSDCQGAPWAGYLGAVWLWLASLPEDVQLHEYQVYIATCWFRGAKGHRKVGVTKRSARATARACNKEELADAVHQEATGRGAYFNWGVGVGVVVEFYWIDSLLISHRCGDLYTADRCLSVPLHS
jgi:hypothetical protein